MLIATPNLCLDRTVRVAEVVPGSVLRAHEVEVTAGGKGVNVARVLRAFGRTATIVGLAADNDRERLLSLLTAEGADVVGVPMPGDVRMAVIMIEEGTRRTTVLNEPGAPISRDTWDRYRQAVADLLPGQDLLVCDGSLPTAAPADAYGQLVADARAAGVPVIVDSAPEPLRAALASGPDLVTPNLEEAEAAIRGDSGHVLVSTGPEMAERAESAAGALVALGARRAAVTVGELGVVLAEDGALTWVPTVPVDVVSAVGAGDSFVAGLALGLLGGASWVEAAARGVATATASCERVLAGGVDPARVEELLTALKARA
ncbi:1-phosphofructokinase family hexose kinase [Actinophytocola sp.]|uniref:1-phosphofructokinase family hexose kinase n=1 Tax=Actinophytocola sp. TaxID=1872138 RepID=UPI003899E422